VLTQGRTTLLYDAGPGGQQIPPELLTGNAEWPKTPAERGTGVRIPCGKGFGVLKHYRRGGWMAGLSVDLYLWSGLERSRPFHEWRMLARLHTQGLPVPRPLLARVLRHGWRYTGDLLTAELPYARSLSAWLAAVPLDGSTWQRIGSVIRRFHGARVEHADLNAHNILLNEAGEISLLDFDKGRICARAGRWQARNLARLHRSLRKLKDEGRVPHWNEADFEALTRGYAKEDARL
jgi:3-deoxy-D-manno-octulosonic acid kinase